MSSPIRVGLVGLGRHTTGSVPGAWAAIGHLPYLLASPRYEVVAIANSTTESAAASIAFHKLDSKVKAYGAVEDLAKDPNVDLVVISVMVTKHYALTKPALEAGKDVFVEWPLGANTTEAEELETLAKSKGVKTIVGLQARGSPIALKLKDILASGKVGKVTSSTVIGEFNGHPHDMWMEGAEYYLDMESGGNAFTVFFGHFLDSFVDVLGNFTRLNSTFHTAYPDVAVKNLSTGEVTNPSYRRTSPDHIIVNGILTSGAVASLAYRTVVGSPIDDTSIRWLITGSSGEIEVVITQRSWQMDPAGTTLKVRYGKDGPVETIELSRKNETPAVLESVFPATNTARIYQAFAEGDHAKFADFSDALATHRLLDTVVLSSK